MQISQYNLNSFPLSIALFMALDNGMYVLNVDMYWHLALLLMYMHVGTLCGVRLLIQC